VAKKIIGQAIGPDQIIVWHRLVQDILSEGLSKFWQGPAIAGVEPFVGATLIGAMLTESTHDEEVKLAQCGVF